jgi:hypothetical protein
VVRVKLPLALAFAVTATGAIAGIATSCNSNDAPTCELFCVVSAPVPNDAGVIVDGPPVTCPDCADPVTLECPAGCEAIG